MSVVISVDGQKIFLNPFITTLASNVLLAIAESLKAPRGHQYEFILLGEELQLNVDQQPVDMNLGRAQRIVGNLLRGFLMSLHGAESGKEFRFVCETERE